MHAHARIINYYTEFIRNSVEREKPIKFGIVYFITIMCLYPRFIKNPRYRIKKGKYDFGSITDERTKYVPIGCGNCIECRQQKAREWATRLHEEIKVQKYAYFCTLTFSNESLETLMKENETDENNAIATIAVRRFLERWRKKFGHSLKHWLITELGHENTERIHLHGILFNNTPITNETLTELWKYGRTDTGQYCNARSINYIVKYVTKIDEQHADYKAVILCSAGLGASYINRFTKEVHAFKGKDTIETYTLPNGNKIALPKYYRNKFWTDKQREQLWLHLLDKEKRYIRGIEFDISKNDVQYFKVLAEQQKDNIKLGYGSTDKKWQAKTYNITYKMLRSATKCKKMQKK